ncbi:MAG: magnesium transporter CorA family protein [Actinomycetes bacterium]
MPTIRIMRSGVISAESSSIDDGLAALEDKDNCVWFDVDPQELPALTEPLGLHHHAVEDAVKAPLSSPEMSQRSKLDRYPGYVFLFLYRTSLDADGSLQMGNIGVFASDRWVIAVNRADGYAHKDLAERWDEHPELLKYGAPALLYAVLDLVVDSHLEAVDALGDDVDRMEDLLFDGDAQFSDDPRDLQRRGFATRKSLVRLRRVAQPMRELVGGLMRREEEDSTPIEAGLMPYYQDVYDHVLRVNDSIEGLRDLLTTIYETRLAMADHTLNTVMKKLTGWAAIIAVPTAVTGFYGQNVPYPGFLHPAGFYTSTFVWVGMSVALFVAFRRRRWI